MGILVCIVIGIVIAIGISAGEGQRWTDNPLPPGMNDLRYDFNGDGKLDDMEKCHQWNDWNSAKSD